MLGSYQTLFSRYFWQLGQGGAISVLLLALLGALIMGLREKNVGGKATWWGVISLFSAGCLAWGAWSVWDQRSMFDDAFVTFRYIDNYMRGFGVVYNIGEYTEGYTNALWALLVTLGHLATGLEIPFTALVLNVIVYAGLVITAVPVGHSLAGAPKRSWPLGAGLLATHLVVAAYATTGMETLLGAWLALGAAGLLHRGGDKSIFGAGLLLALAITHRLDHGIFWAAGVLAVAMHVWDRPAGRRLKPVLYYLAPVVLVLAHLAWKYAYYGDILPNTFYAKGGDSWRADQGLLYIMTFFLGSHGWMILPLSLGFLCVPGDKSTRPVRVFIAAACSVWFIYLLKVGGDFMYGRFCLPIFPLLLIAAHAMVFRAKTSWVRIGLASVLLASGGGIDIIRQGHGHFLGQANESAVYPIIDFFPIKVKHSSWRDGNNFKRYFTDRGIDVYLGSCCIGMLGYYSRQPLMDFHGLTDAEVAHLPMVGRSLTGHEKWAPYSLVRSRGVQIARGGGRDLPRFVKTLAQIDARSVDGRFAKGKFGFVYWDPKLVKQLRERSPEVKFTDMPRWLDSYLGTLYRKDRKRIAAELVGLKLYYFDHNDDPKRLEAIESYVAGGPPPPREKRRRLGSDRDKRKKDK